MKGYIAELYVWSAHNVISYWTWLRYLPCCHNASAVMIWNTHQSVNPMISIDLITVSFCWALERMWDIMAFLDVAGVLYRYNRYNVFQVERNWTSVVKDKSHMFFGRLTKSNKTDCLLFHLFPGWPAYRTMMFDLQLCCVPMHLVKNRDCY